MSSRLGPLKARRVEERMHVKSVGPQAASHWLGVVVRRKRGTSSGIVLFTFDHGSKGRGPSPKDLVEFKSVTLIFT
ncbi:hypothetical protein TNCV_4419931 [Trichonephila clavipes]|nr:hypothetical protein TNCV_4419931 [Trichonephila clavipes]